MYVYTYNVRKLHRLRMLEAFSADTIDTTRLWSNCTASALFGTLHEKLASLDRHAQLTRCFSAVAELLVCNGQKPH